MHISFFIIAFVSATLLTFLFSFIVERFARARAITDVPSLAPERKVHTRATPLLGGAAIFVSFVAVVLGAVALGVHFEESAIPLKYLVGTMLGGVVIMIGGFLDDRMHWSPSKQIIFPIVATFIVIGSGIGIAYITNPLGGILSLNEWSTTLFWWQGIPYRLTLPSDLFTFLWLMGMMYTTKFLDGLDGLVSGVTVIGALTIAALAFQPVVAQGATALLAVILAGSFLGFIPWNWHPARMFLGEGGSLFAGFMLGVLAIISGSKVATTFLVVGIPILDALWVILRRIVWEHRSPFAGDRRHLHHRLLDVGFSHRSVVGMFYFLAAYFGVAALFMQSRGKFIAFVILSSTMVVLGAGLVYSYWRRKQTVCPPKFLHHSERSKNV